MDDADSASSIQSQSIHKREQPGERLFPKVLRVVREWELRSNRGGTNPRGTNQGSTLRLFSRESTVLGMDYRFTGPSRCDCVPFTWQANNNDVATTCLVVVEKENPLRFQLAIEGARKPKLKGLEYLVKLPAVIVGFTCICTSDQALIFEVGKRLMDLLASIKRTGVGLVIEICGVATPGQNVQLAWKERGKVRDASQTVADACEYLGLTQLYGCFEPHTLGPVMVSKDCRLETLEPYCEVRLEGSTPDIRWDIVRRRFESLGLQFPSHTVELRFVETRDEFVERIRKPAPDWAIASTVGEHGIVICNQSIWNRSTCPSSLEQIILHELAHLVIHERSQDVPLWLDEGFAMLVAGQLGDCSAELRDAIGRRETGQDGNRVRDDAASAIPNLFERPDLAEGSQPHDSMDSYEYSALLIGALLTETDEGSLAAKILKSTEEGGASYDELLVEATSIILQARIS